METMLQPSGNVACIFCGHGGDVSLSFNAGILRGVVTSARRWSTGLLLQL